MANELKYGDKIHLQNGYNGWKGGYLDTNGHSTDSGGKYAVSTAESPTRGEGTGTWEILSLTGKAVGSPVISGDVIQLRNLYGGDGGYLDTNGHATVPSGTPAPSTTSPRPRTRTARPTLVPAAGASPPRPPRPPTRTSVPAT
ncbi:hypothetical protein NRF20_17945 [Streptomyces sp. R-74717]|uniref:hypothetical protein n=1 Tax=Streptomyces TaxID=1883 RepID=UPI0037BBFB98